MVDRVMISINVNIIQNMIPKIPIENGGRG